MDHQYTSILSEKERAALRAQRAQARKRKLQARRRRQMKQFLPVAALAIFLLVFLTAWRQHHQPEPEDVTPPSVATSVSIPEVQPEPEEPRRRRWPWVLGAVAVIAVIIVFVNLFDKLESMGISIDTLTDEQARYLAGWEG